MRGRLSTWFWYKMLRAISRRRGRGWKSCANRHETRCDFGRLEVTITIRDKRKPDGYSREELCEMLALVRRHEKLQDWRVPEAGSEEDLDYVILKNGSRERRLLVSQIMVSLRHLFAASQSLAAELVQKASDPTHYFSEETALSLRKFGLIENDGSMSSTVSNVVLSAAFREATSDLKIKSVLQLVDPIEC